MKLLGVDLGFSTTRASTAMAFLDGDHFGVGRAGTTWESRKAQIPCEFRPTVIAVDGPILPEGADERDRRLCETVFIHAPFQNRCKPGLSHWGLGWELRRASAEAYAQFSPVLISSSSESRKAVCRDGPIVEAFPNAFLGCADTGSRTSVGTEAKAWTAIRLAIRADGDHRKTGIGPVAKSRYA